MDYIITMVTASISDSGKNEYKNQGKKTQAMTEKFRLLDDDGIVYFYGYATEQEFDPLDEYGECYGCTMIEYKNPITKKYEML